MSQHSIRLGVIGLGNIGKQHIANVTGGNVPGCDLAAICSRSDSGLAAELGVRHFNDYRDLVSQPKATVEALYEAFDLPMSSEYRSVLEARDNKARTHKTRHKYSAREFGMDVTRMYRELADFYEIYGWPIPGEQDTAEAT